MFRENPLEDIQTRYRTILANFGNVRSSIPAKEIWRFFVDGKQQEKGKKITNYFSDSIPDLTIKQFAEQEVKEGDWHQSRFIHFLKKKNWRLTDAECEELKVADFLAMDIAWLQYENEAGYLKALYLTFPEIFNLDKKFDSEFIEYLHGKAVNKVKNTNYDLDLNQEINKFRTDECAAFYFEEGNVSPQGILEFWNRYPDYDEDAANNIYIQMTISDPETKSNEGYIRFHPQSIEAIRELAKALDENNGVQRAKNKLNLCCESDDNKKFHKMLAEHPDISTLVKIIGRTESNEELANCLYDLAKNPPNSYFFISVESEQVDDPQKTLTKKVKKHIEEYELAIQIAKYKPKEKLMAIIDLIQKLHQLHPFIDGNGRTFCILSLDFLLMQNGFPPAILNDTSLFSLCSQVEIYDAVILGMKNTLALSKGKNLYHVNTDAVLDRLKKNEKLFKYYKEFEEAVEIEEACRKISQPIKKLV